MDISNTAFAAFSLNMSLSTGQIALFIELVVFVSIVSLVVLFCTLSIAAFLRKSTLSQTSLAHYRRIFFLLLAQIACPAIFIFVPFMAAIVAIVARMDTSPLFADKVGFLNSYFIVYSTPAFGLPVIASWIATVSLVVLLSTTAVLVVNSFIYRYIQMCRSRWFDLFPIETATLFALLSFALIVNICAFVYVTYTFGSDVDKWVLEVLRRDDMDINNTAFGAFSLNMTLSTGQIVLFIEFALFIQMVSLAVLFCTLSIAAFLRNSTLSATSLAHYRRMFFLLLAQIACPAIFIFVPLAAAFVVIVARIDTSPLFSDAVDLLISLHPLVNSLIVILFLDDYRRFLLVKLSCKAIVVYGVCTFGSDVDQSVLDVLRRDDMDITNTAFAAFSLNRTMSFGQMILFIEFVLFVSTVSLAVVFCSLSIAAFLRNSTLSETSLAHYRRMFFLLLAQIMETLRRSEMNFSSIIVQTICLLSLLSNFTLLILVFACPVKRVGSYKYFFLLSAVNDMAFSVAHGISQPKVISVNSYFVVYSTPIHGLPLVVNWIGVLSLIVLLSTTGAVVVNSFMYRYIQLYRSACFDLFPIWMATMFTFITFATTANGCVFAFVVFSFGNDVDQSIRELLHDAGLEINNTAIGGFSLQKTLNAGQMALLIQFVSCTLIWALGVLFCALRIAALLRKSTLSKTSLVHHRRMFFLLLAQTACPGLFICLPMVTAAGIIFAGIETSALYADMLDMFLSFHPLGNPIIVILFLDDYRSFILTLLIYLMENSSFENPGEIYVARIH
ncbi:hypothetical protein Q1695_007334 [Nippostrongylus brasiliensis]|nr:hypothetical protein Q1695_007334 [Nippostrongylus brasiliensis]